MLNSKSLIKQSALRTVLKLMGDEVNFCFKINGRQECHMMLYRLLIIFFFFSFFFISFRTGFFFFFQWVNFVRLELGISHKSSPNPLFLYWVTPHNFSPFYNVVHGFMK